MAYSTGKNSFPNSISVFRYYFTWHTFLSSLTRNNG